MIGLCSDLMAGTKTVQNCRLLNVLNEIIALVAVFNLLIDFMMWHDSRILQLTLLPVELFFEKIQKKKVKLLMSKSNTNASAQTVKGSQSSDLSHTSTIWTAVSSHKAAHSQT